MVERERQFPTSGIARKLRIILQTVLGGISLSNGEIKKAKEFANNLKSAINGTNSQKMMNQVARNNINRNKNLGQYIAEADAYGVDLSFINDNVGSDRESIAKAYGKDISSSSSKISAVDPVAQLKGSNYTNMALYEIYRRLNEGINVFQVGNSKIRNGPFEKFGDDFLTKPLGHKPKPKKD
jgi:hypothetical protein